jgi:hypothetical protein
MKKVIKIGSISDQDQFRRDGYLKMTPNQRVSAVLEMQANYLRWDLNPRIEFIGKLKMVNFQDVTETN